MFSSNAMTSIYGQSIQAFFEFAQMQMTAIEKTSERCLSGMRDHLVQCQNFNETLTDEKNPQAIIAKILTASDIANKKSQALMQASSADLVKSLSQSAAFVQSQSQYVRKQMDGAAAKVGMNAPMGTDALIENVRTAFQAGTNAFESASKSFAQAIQVAQDGLTALQGAKQTESTRKAKRG